MQINPSDIPEVPMPFMHATHLEEVKMLNALYALFDRQKSGQSVPGLSAELEALAAHTHTHFAREEESMLALCFPPYPVHKQAHDDYLRVFDALMQVWRKIHDVQPVAAFLQDTTPGWMLQHISSMDRVTARYLAMHEAG